MKPHTQIAAAYLVFGILWILISDWAVSNLTGEPREIVILEILKGCLFVLSSALLIFFLARKAEKEIQKKEEAKKEDLRRLLAGVHHILLNYLNQMQLVTLEAENNRKLTPETLDLARQLSEDAATELKRLEHSSLAGKHSSAQKEFWQN